MSKINSDARQRRLTERRAKLYHLPSIFIGIHKAVEDGATHFWRARGMEPPAPTTNFDPFVGRDKKNKATKRRITSASALSG